MSLYQRFSLYPKDKAIILNTQIRLTNSLRFRYLYLAVSVCLLLRIGFFLVASPWSEDLTDTRFLVADAEGYHSLAVKIVNGEPLGRAGVLRTPGYPGFLALCYSLFGKSLWPVLLLQILASAAITIAILVIGKIWFSERTGFIAAMLYSVDPHSILAANSILGDLLFTALLVLSALLFFLGRHQNKLRIYFFVGCLVGLATLVRPVGQFIPIIYLGLAWFACKEKRYFPLKAGVLIIATVLVIAPWLVRNNIEYGILSLTSGGAMHLVHFVVPYTIVSTTGKTLEVARAEVRESIQDAAENYDSLNPLEQASVEQQVAVEYITSNLGAYIVVSARGVANMILNLGTEGIVRQLGLKSTTLDFNWHDVSIGIIERIKRFAQVKQPIEIGIGLYVAIIHGISYLGFLAGAYFCVRQKYFAPLFFTLALIVVICAFIGPIGEARYKLGFAPFFLIVAAFGIERLAANLCKPLTTRK